MSEQAKSVDLAPPAPPPLAVNEVEAARLLGVSVRTIRYWRQFSRGPAWSKLGGRVVYEIDILRKYLAANRQPVRSPSQESK